ncbi:MAG: NERD domain-containing protein [Vulcanimicrobiaceae bacterium]
MAVVHKPAIDEPGHHGEFELAAQLTAINDNQLHLWFSIDCVPNAKDIDILVYHETLGLFVIEVKAVAISDIELLTYDECLIPGRKERRNPNKQARSAMYSLMNVLRPRVRRAVPDDRDIAVTFTSCWPRIERRRWNEHWSSDDLKGDYAERMLFREDVSTGGQVFRARLDYIRAHPPAGEFRAPAFRHSPKVLQSIIDALRPEARPQPAPSDIERLRVIEGKVAAEALKDAPVGTATHLFYEGAPGTGKTFRLLQIGAAHAAAGRRTLYVCFNKVLAADIKRILSHSESLKASKAEFDVYDVFELLGIYAAKYDIEDYTHDEWAEQIVDDLRSKVIERYDTVLIDEAQDLKPWALELVDLHTGDEATVCVGHGSGQNLYDSDKTIGPSPDKQWLAEFKRGAGSRPLRRNFRNTEPMLKLAQTFYEAFGHGNQKIYETLARFKDGKKSKQLSFPECERKTGALPTLRQIDETNIDEYLRTGWTGLYADEQRRLAIVRYKEVIQSEVNALRDDQRPIDVLILVPGERSNQEAWARTALESLGYQYIDYTRPSRRREIAYADTIRLCTFHSSRGIEAHRVIVFGVESLGDLSAGVNASANNLGYIVLSRALIDLAITRRYPIKSGIIDFLETTLAAIAKGQ